MRTLPLLLIGWLAVGLAGCETDEPGVSGAAPSVALSTDEMRTDIQRLSSDDFQGRGPSSPGEDSTVAYLTDRYREIGLEPGNGTSYSQDVSLVEITATPDMTLTVEDETGTSPYTYGEDFMAWTKRVTEEASLDASEMVFVGYGITAPEYGWDDYAGLDVAGKTVVMLVNDPGFATSDTSLFKGNTMTYYGRWTYKYEEAARQGAEAALIVHDTAPAGYPWDVVRGSWSGPQFDLANPDSNASRVAVEGWLQLEVATALFERAGQNFDSLRAQAARPGFRAVPLNLNASVDIRNTLRGSTSRNVIGILPGRVRPEEYVVYTAHWDHLGRDPSLTDDPIYNGAFDNATGVAGLLALADAFTRLDPAPERSVVFIALTAEEQGLLGAAYYAENPVYPLAKTAAAINMDGLNVIGPTHDITVVGYGNSELDTYLEEAAAAHGRVVRPDPEPEKGFFFRSDHFSFAKEGVPALYTDAGIDHVERGEEFALAQREDYVQNRYHKPSDEYDPNWDLSGAVEDLELMFDVGYRVANESSFPDWNDGSAFKARRTESLQTIGIE